MFGFFEGTTVSVGRGTQSQFQIYGAPYFPKTNFSLTLKPNEGAKYPKHENKICYGRNLSTIKKLSSLNLEWLIDAFEHAANKKIFFNRA